MSPEARNWLMLWRVKGQPQIVGVKDFYTRIPEEVYDYVDSFIMQVASGTIEILKDETGVFKLRARFEHHKKDRVCVSLEQAKVKVREIIRRYAA
jgi:hypothetical protein